VPPDSDKHRTLAGNHPFRGDLVTLASRRSPQETFENARAGQGVSFGR
jgi:hypothetical protein